MTAPFIDDTGFHAFGLANWQTALNALWQAAYGSSIDLSAKSPDGQIIGALVGIWTDIEQLIDTVYQGGSPSGAVGAALSRLIQLNGITRQAAVASSAPVTLGGTPGTVIPAGSLIASSTDPTKPPFVTSGTSPADDLTIGGGGTVTGTVVCTVSGPITAITGELTKMVTVIAGWTSVTNTTDVVPGRQVEADPAVRARRAASVAIPSQSLTDGLRAALANIGGITNARVYENRTASTDSKGLPAHSINAIIRGSGASADIANAMFTKGGQGVTMIGAQSANVVDQQGNPQQMNWDIATDVDVYIIIKLDSTPSNLSYIQAQMSAAIVSFYSPTGDLPIDIGDNVAWLDIATPVNALGLTGRKGLPSVTNIFLGSAPGPTLQADLVMLYRSIAVFDPSRILVQGP